MDASRLPPAPLQRPGSHHTGFSPGPPRHPLPTPTPFLLFFTSYWISKKNCSPACSLTSHLFYCTKLPGIVSGHPSRHLGSALHTPQSSTYNQQKAAQTRVEIKRWLKSEAAPACGTVRADHLQVPPLPTRPRERVSSFPGKCSISCAHHTEHSRWAASSVVATSRDLRSSLGNEAPSFMCFGIALFILPLWAEAGWDSNRKEQILLLLLGTIQQKILYNLFNFPGTFLYRINNST